MIDFVSIVWLSLLVYTFKPVSELCQCNDVKSNEAILLPGEYKLTLKGLATLNVKVVS